MTCKRRAICTVLVAIAFSFLVACGDDDKVVGSGDETAINMVKDGAFSAYPDRTVGELVACFFGNPKWESLRGTDGNTYVNLTGRMTYMDKPVDALVQFRVDKVARTFVISAFEMNGIPQNQLMIAALVEAMVEEDC